MCLALATEQYTMFRDLVTECYPTSNAPACSSTPLERGTWLERRGSISVAMGKGPGKGLETGLHNNVMVIGFHGVGGCGG